MQPVIKKKKPRVMYVDNIAFEQALIAYKKAVKKAKREKQEKPQIPNYLGECFLKIATHLSYSPNFIGYSFREEMVSDGVENCLMYFENYNPNAISRRTGKKTMGPFPYFTQIIYYAFCRRIAKENKQSYVKAKSVETSNILNELTQEDMDLLNADLTASGGKQTVMYDNISDLIMNFEDKLKKKKDKKIISQKKKTLDNAKEKR